MLGWQIGVINKDLTIKKKKKSRTVRNVFPYGKFPAGCTAIFFLLVEGTVEDAGQLPCIQHPQR